MRFINNSSLKITKKKRALIAYVSLFLAVMLFSSGTFSWFTVKDTATIESDELTMIASSGLRVNEGEDISNVISLDNVNLSEVSSVDGRNVFLPISGSYSSNTNEMFFREATVGDQNKYFAYKDFTKSLFVPSKLSAKSIRTNSFFL